jgi:hypothetical protein
MIGQFVANAADPCPRDENGTELERPFNLDGDFRVGSPLSIRGRKEPGGAKGYGSTQARPLVSERWHRQQQRKGQDSRDRNPSDAAPTRGPVS